MTDGLENSLDAALADRDAWRQLAGELAEALDKIANRNLGGYRLQPHEYAQAIARQALATYKAREGKA